MTDAELLAFLVVACSFSICAIHTFLAIRGHTNRWLDVLIALSSGWLGIVFLLNFSNSLPPTVGRPPLVTLLAAELARAIYLIRMRRMGR